MVQGVVYIRPGLTYGQDVEAARCTDAGRIHQHHPSPPPQRADQGITQPPQKLRQANS